MFKTITTQEITSFQQKILAWYKTHKRDLPWRETRDPYKILLSEVMSQQTQLSRVIPKYEAWLKAFPTLESLANESNSEVLKLWSGLGYNRRALFLKKTAEAIVQTYHGTFPQTLNELKKLPGIGEYTARAVMCFAFNQQLAVLDTNVRKVLLTQFVKKDVLHVRMTDKQLMYIAEQLLPKGKAYEWNQALMDYAAAVLKSEKIPIKKQSSFKTSKRFIRGQIIKLLVNYQSLSQDQLKEMVEQNHQSFEEVICDLIKDGLIHIKNDKVFLS